MKAKTLSIVVSGITLLLLAVGAAGAISNRSTNTPAAVTAAVSSGISYQGRLTDPQGAPLDGSYTMRFVVYDVAVAGTALWDSGNMSVSLDKGLFTVKLGVDPADFDGRALWLSIIIEGETLSPRQEILPAPYALSLRPGADIVGSSISPLDANLASYAPATGTALYADANGGIGIYGDSENNYGVYGSSDNSSGGYFTSVGGFGIRVSTSGAAHYDHGAYITANQGYGAYVQSANNAGVRAESGDVGSLYVSSGQRGVIGIGESGGVYGGSSTGSGVYGRSVSGRGIYAASDTGYGLYSSSNENYGIYGRSRDDYAGYFHSDNYRGIYVSSDSGWWAARILNRGGSSSSGLYVDGTLQVTGAKTGYVVDLCLNDGTEPLEIGDVVAVVGVSDPVVGEIPVMKVVKATADNASAVVGIVDQRFIVPTAENARASDKLGEDLPHPDPVVARQATGNAIQPGEYLSVVTLGAFKLIKVDADFGAIQPGDLLTPSPNPGHAARVSATTPGTIVGKALEGLDAGQGLIAVYVTLQ